MADRTPRRGGELPVTELELWAGGLLLLAAFWLLVRAFAGPEPLPGGELPANVIGIGGGRPPTPLFVVFAGMAAALTAVMTALGAVWGNDVRPTTRPFLLGLASWAAAAAYLLFSDGSSVSWMRLGAALVAALVAVAVGCARREAPGPSLLRRFTPREGS